MYKRNKSLLSRIVSRFGDDAFENHPFEVCPSSEVSIFAIRPKTHSSIRLFLILFLLVFSFGCQHYKDQNLRKLNDSPLSIEQKAIDFLADSLLLSHVFNVANVVRVPHPIDSNWISKGFLWNYRITINSAVTSISNPEIESLILIDTYMYFSDSPLEEIKEYNEYFRREKADSSQTLYINIPRGFVYSDYEGFKARMSNKEIFLQVGKKLSPAKQRWSKCWFLDIAEI